MTAVSRFEADLLKILHALLGRAPADSVVTLISKRREAPDCLSAGAVALVEDALKKGCVWRLAREGGWQTRRHLRGDQIATGRTWERTPPERLGLNFSEQSLAFLIWLTAEHPGSRALAWSPEDASLAMGDRLLVFLAFDALAKTSLVASLVENPAIAANGLIRLMYPEYFGAASRVVPHLTPWTEGIGSVVVEAFQPMLARRWLELEKDKTSILMTEVMISLGEAQTSILNAWFDALEAAGRLDLASFALEAAGELLRGAPDARMWVRSVDWKGRRLADRSSTFEQATAFLRALDRLRRWERNARTVSFIDEGYAASQLWKSQWETHDGEVLHAKASSVIRELDPLGLASPPA